VCQYWGNYNNSAYTQYKQKNVYPAKIRYKK
jgi:hypothetical protein